MPNKTFLAVLLLGLLAAGPLRSEPGAATVERQVADAVQSSQPTVVHFWATWCPNCRAELKSGGWKRTIEANPGTQFVFVTVWSPDDGRRILAQFGIGSQKNFTLIGHPSHERTKETRLNRFLDQPLAWIPETLIYQNGQLHYAMNYGEMHFPILQQFITDCSNSWDRPALSGP